MDNEKTLMSQFQDSYDWGEAFEVAQRDKVQRVMPPWMLDGDQAGVSLEAFTTEDVIEVLHLQEGENDVDLWVGVFKLKDNRYVLVDAWCDYTGLG